MGYAAPGGGYSCKILVGVWCPDLQSKPYFRQENVIFHTRFQNWSLNSIPTDSNEAVWPVPYAWAQPYHRGSGSHRQLFRPCWSPSAWHSRRINENNTLTHVSETHYCRGECKHSFKGQLHREQVVAVGWERYKQFSHGMRMEMGSENWSVCPYPFSDLKLLRLERQQNDFLNAISNSRNIFLPYS